MWAIALTSALLWALVVERLLYLLVAFPRYRNRLLRIWQQFQPESRWVRQRIRSRLISVTRQRLERNQPVIRVLVAICPLLGLLGTVTGMLTVFDVLAFTGPGKPGPMPAGVPGQPFPR